MNNSARQLATWPVVVCIRQLWTRATNCPNRAFNCRTRKLLKGKLVWYSRLKVELGINAIRLSRRATTSYGRFSCLISEPSPSQPPAETPMNVVHRPSGATVSTLTMPSMTPTQYSAGSPSRQMTDPAAKCCSRVSRTTRSICACVRPCAHAACRSMLLAVICGVVIGGFGETNKPRPYTQTRPGSPGAALITSASIAYCLHDDSTTPLRTGLRRAPPPRPFH